MKKGQSLEVIKAGQELLQASETEGLEKPQEIKFWKSCPRMEVKL